MAHTNVQVKLAIVEREHGCTLDSDVLSVHLSWEDIGNLARLLTMKETVDEVTDYINDNCEPDNTAWRSLDVKTIAERVIYNRTASESTDDVYDVLASVAGRC